MRPVRIFPKCKSAIQKKSSTEIDSSDASLGVHKKSSSFSNVSDDDDDDDEEDNNNENGGDGATGENEDGKFDDLKIS